MFAELCLNVFFAPLDHDTDAPVAALKSVEKSEISLLKDMDVQLSSL